MPGFLDFDPDKWSPSGASDPEPEQPAKVAKPAKDKPTLATLATLAAASLPQDVQFGLERLGSMKPPRLRHPEHWPAAVEDAFRLVSEGWADAALSLGWSPLDLFGAVPDDAGEADADGLAVKLGGRRVLAICASFATVSNGASDRAYLYRGNNDGAVLLWALGRGR